MTVTLPEPRNPDSPYAVALVCMGNICRSPMAATVLRERLHQTGLDQRVRVGSSGIGDWHVGQPMDRRAAATLAEHGYDPSSHRAKTFDASWFDRYDVILVMDDGNHEDVLAQATDDRERSRVLMFRVFDPEADGDLVVPDPWYGGVDGFEHVLAIVERTVGQLVQQLADRTA